MFGVKYKLGLVVSGILGSKQEFRSSYLNNLKRERDFITDEISKIDELLNGELKKQSDKCVEMQKNIKLEKSFVNDDYKNDFIKEVDFLAEMSEEFEKQRELNQKPLYDRLEEVQEGIEYLRTAIKITNQTREISPSMHEWYK